MRRTVVVTALLTLACSCDSYRGPRLSISTAASPSRSVTTERASLSRASGVGTATIYGGRTPEQWAQVLNTPNREEVAEAARALKVLGTEGRPYLLQGLESSQAETRRLCLENLTVSDFKTLGEAGRQLLVKLAGDPADMRIRGRATAYLSQWNGTIPAP